MINKELTNPDTLSFENRYLNYKNDSGVSIRDFLHDSDNSTEEKITLAKKFAETLSSSHKTFSDMLNSQIEKWSDYGFITEEPNILDRFVTNTEKTAIFEQDTNLESIIPVVYDASIVNKLSFRSTFVKAIVDPANSSVYDYVRGAAIPDISYASETIDGKYFEMKSKFSVGTGRLQLDDYQYTFQTLMSASAISHKKQVAKFLLNGTQQNASFPCISLFSKAESTGIERIASAGAWYAVNTGVSNPDNIVKDLARALTSFVKDDQKPDTLVIPSNMCGALYSVNPNWNVNLIARLQTQFGSEFKVEISNALNGINEPDNNKNVNAVLLRRSPDVLFTQFGDFCGVTNQKNDPNTQDDTYHLRTIYSTLRLQKPYAIKIITGIDGA